MRNRHIWGHIFFWALWYSMWILLSYVDFRSIPSLFIYVSFLVSVQIVTSYLNVLLLIPRLFYRRKYILFFSIYLAVVCIAARLVADVTMIITRGAIRSTVNNDYYNWDSQFIYGVLITIFSNSLVAVAKIAYDHFQAENRSKELEKDKLESELKFLKAQINPHFLFNTLNSIFNLIDKDTAQAKALLIQFSDMLRYHLYDTNVEKIPLETEILYIKNYAQMEKVRKGKNIYVHLEIDEQLQYMEIVPLMLITFVENAFKHVSAYFDKPNRVCIYLTGSSEYLHFRVENSKDDTLGYARTDASGIGLNNVKRRLELMYPEAYQLEISNKPDLYQVCLQLKVDKYKP